jgi:hypothetical protein
MELTMDQALAEQWSETFSEYIDRLEAAAHSPSEILSTLTVTPHDQKPNSWNLVVVIGDRSQRLETQVDCQVLLMNMKMAGSIVMQED